MVKNIFLSILTFLSFSLLPVIEQEQVISVQESNEKQRAIEHIQQEIKTVMMERNFAIEVFNKIESYFQNILKDSYQEAKANCLRLLITILESDELAVTVEQVTNDQRDYICDKLLKFNCSLMRKKINNSLLGQARIKIELNSAKFDATTEHLFDKFYFVAVILLGTKALLAKLEARINELSAELKAE